MLQKIIYISNLTFISVIFVCISSNAAKSENSENNYKKYKSLTQK